MRVSLPCVGGDSDALAPHATIEIDGQREPLAVCDVGYRAEFFDIARPFDTITLRLPEGERPRPWVAVRPEA